VAETPKRGDARLHRQEEIGRSPNSYFDSPGARRAAGAHDPRHATKLVRKEGLLMVRWRLWLAAAVVLSAARPALAAPMVRATLSHMCCGSCANNVKGGIAGIPWIADVKTDLPTKSVTVTAKEGMPIDVAALMDGLRKAGFPPQDVVLTGARVMDVNAGHLCCGGCVGPLKAALAGVSWIESADVKPNSPVRITARAGSEIKLGELVAVMERAGYSANAVTVVAS
jgi:copper chaperone CopZ